MAGDVTQRIRDRITKLDADMATFTQQANAQLQAMQAVKNELTALLDEPQPQVIPAQGIIPDEPQTEGV